MEQNELQVTQFNYGQLDSPTSEFLKSKENSIKTIIGKTAESLGKELSEAQNKLSGSNQYDGVFEKWYTSLGFKKQTVYNYINYHNLLVQQLDNQNFIEDLPKTVAYAIANPNVNQELKQSVLSGDITTLKEYKELEKQKKLIEEEKSKLEETNYQLEQSFNELSQKYNKELNK